MPKPRPSSEELRQQIEIINAKVYSTDEIEQRIADALLYEGRFDAEINAAELAVILRNVVYTMFARYELAGLNVDLVHNVPNMKVSINNGQAQVRFIVHIHKPIVAFLEFRYALVNDPVALSPRLRLRQGSLRYKENTRRLDLKAKAALAAVNIKHLATQELSDANGIILSTLPPRLREHGIVGSISKIELGLRDECLRVLLEGAFEPLAQGLA